MHMAACSYLSPCIQLLPALLPLLLELRLQLLVLGNLLLHRPSPDMPALGRCQDTLWVLRTGSGFKMRSSMHKSGCKQLEAP